MEILQDHGSTAGGDVMIGEQDESRSPTTRSGGDGNADTGPGEVAMPVIVVTRLRLKDPALLNEFFVDAVAAIDQAQKSAGNLGADALADANNAWWSVSAWQERDPMLAFVTREPHKSIQSRLDHYCAEATFVDWEQDSPDLPDWQTSWRHLTADGQVAELTSPSAANQTRAFPQPGETSCRRRRPGHCAA